MIPHIGSIEKWSQQKELKNRNGQSKWIFEGPSCTGSPKICSDKSKEVLEERIINIPWLSRLEYAQASWKQASPLQQGKEPKYF